MLKNWRSAFYTALQLLIKSCEQDANAMKYRYLNIYQPQCGKYEGNLHGKRANVSTTNIKHSA